ncbi:oligosaccharide flippase family protein [Defluviitalea raffinosedens]|uniref:Oligosaccharide flippase family protein n=1 Tax=Defluviitalea raffinosedens TaxID=1450156 RepID=A0A7C8LTM8_9FIRM|nr:oligosaccharide flippase family protein [Defluviitalea raffinosedens]KAE9634982.1 oligosaccharide flippase family protein [Defluviitalea raffinosedens]
MTKNKDINVVFSNTIMLYIMQISGYIFPLLTFPYLTRVLGPEKYGILVFVNAAMIYFQMFVDYGFLLSATKECSLHRNDKEKLGEILFSVIQSKLLLSFVGLIVILISINTVSVFEDKKMFMLLSYIPVILSSFIPDYLFRGIEKMNIITYRTIISKAIFTGLIFIFVKTPDEYLYIPLLTSVGNICVILMTWYVIFNKLEIKFKAANFKQCLSALKESSIFFLSRIASTVYGASNTFILGFNHSSSLLAQFGAASSLIGSARSMFSPIADSLYPYMITKKNYKLIKKILFLLMPVICLGVIVLFIFAEPIVILVCGKEYIGAVPTFRALLPLLVITLPMYILGFPVLGAMGKMKEANLSVIYASIFHIIGLIILLLTNNLNFILVSILTCITETIILILRVIYSINNKG